MTNIIIDDLVENRELGRHEMATLLGGLAGRYLFSFPLAQQQMSFPGITNIYNVSQFFVDTFQINVLNQAISVLNSNGINITQQGNNQNLASEIVVEAPSFPSFPSIQQ